MVIKLHKMYQCRCTANNSWWWSERLPETCRVVIPIKLEFSASVGFIHKGLRGSLFAIMRKGIKKDEVCHQFQSSCLIYFGCLKEAVSQEIYSQCKISNLLAYLCSIIIKSLRTREVSRECEIWFSFSSMHFLGNTFIFQLAKYLYIYRSSCGHRHSVGLCRKSR
jgi:hypothetical protein